MSKYSEIREAWASGDHLGALRIAARFFDRSVDTQIFKRGMDAHNHPAFYRQLREDPDQITAEALRLLAVKFGLNDHGPPDQSADTAQSACRGRTCVFARLAPYL
jgi:hypothetical protein